MENEAAIYLNSSLSYLIKQLLFMVKLRQTLSCMSKNFDHKIWRE